MNASYYVDQPRATRMSFRGAALSVLALAVLAGALAGCASTSQARSVETSGFLNNYAQLSPGEEGQARLVYVSPTANFKQYSKILMDPIVVQASPENSKLNEVPKEELQAIVDYMDATMREHLQGDYTFVNTAGPDTMRLRIALTEAKGSNILLATSSISPTGMALSSLKKAATGKSTGVAEASAEMELIDSVSGERLTAAVDSRVGGTTNAFSKWEGIREAYDYWAERLRVRLSEFRSQ